MRVAIVENTKVSHLGQVGVALAEAGVMIEVFRPYLDGKLPDPQGDYVGLVVFGGEQSAIDDALHPYLPALAREMRAFDEAGRSVLGICLGAQLLARAWGAANHVGTSREFGWQTIERKGTLWPLTEKETKWIKIGSRVYPWVCANGTSRNILCKSIDGNLFSEYRVLGIDDRPTNQKFYFIDEKIPPLCVESLCGIINR